MTWICRNSNAVFWNVPKPLQSSRNQSE